MKTSRRDFFSMLGIASGAFIAPKGMYAALAPNRKLRMGVVSDVHISFSSPELWKWKKALEHFRDVKVDVVAVAGDLANEGLITELEAFAKAWYEIFPDNKRPDGARVEHVFSMGNHDVGVWDGIKKRYIKKGEDGKEILDEEALKKILICHNRERVWKELFHDEYSHFYAKNVKGYWFLASHWRSAGQKHEYEALELPAYLKDHADELGKTKPFFFVQHPHPRGTCHGQDAWWPDSGKNTTEVLKDFPNAVCFSGHSHNPLTDAKTIWQGGFTSLGAGSLSYCSPLGNDPTPDIRAAASAPEGHPYGISNGDCHDGYVIDVHDGFLAVRRMEFKYLKPLGPEWIVPVPVKPDPEFAFEKRRLAQKPPAYRETPKVEFRKVMVKRWNGTLDEMQQVAFKAVPQADKAHSRVYAYEFTMRPKDGSPTTISNIKSAAADMAPEMEPEEVLWNVKPGTFTKPEDYDFGIVPFDSFRTRADRKRKCFALCNRAYLLRVALCVNTNETPDTATNNAWFVSVDFDGVVGTSGLPIPSSSATWRRHWADIGGLEWAELDFVPGDRLLVGDTKVSLPTNGLITAFGIFQDEHVSTSNMRLDNVTLYTRHVYPPPPPRGTVLMVQ